MTQKIAKLNIYVALSGGVDSSVALSLLKERGHNVTGVYFKTYKPDGNREYCRRQGMDAQAVCKHLGVPFKVFDLQEEYKHKVFEYMIKGYEQGLTPNPDIMCNREIKFGVFAERAFAEGADMIATGHYANTLKLEDLTGDDPAPATSALLRSGGLSSDLGSLTEQAQETSSEPKSCGWPSQDIPREVAMMTMAKDQSKDQTYFLSQVRSEVLARTIFPLGGLLKSEVRKLAAELGLPTARKKESQGICFIGQEMDVKAFLKKYIPEHPGSVLNTAGDVAGKHMGAKFYTVGERHGFTILPEHKSADMPRLYVISRDMTANTITVGTKEELDAQAGACVSITIGECNWVSGPPESSREYKCRIRHRGELHTCVPESAGGGRWRLNFADAPYAPAAGQFAALYDGDICLGGGVMRP